MNQSKDHFVAKTYLNRFLDVDKSLWVYDKQWLNIKAKTPSQICKEPGGSDNRFLEKDRAIEDFLSPIENAWSNRMDILQSADNISSPGYLAAKSTICSYMAYLRNYTPATTRVEQEALAAQLETTAQLLYKSGASPPPPKELKNLDNPFKEAQFNVDSKFPRAIAAGALHEISNTFFYSPIAILHNNTDSLFLTSDNPLSLWYKENPLSPYLYLPLTPRLAILVSPFKKIYLTDFYDHSKDQFIDTKLESIHFLNQLTVKHAEEIVISSQCSDSILELVKEFKDWQLTNFTVRIKYSKGVITQNTSRVAKKGK